MPHYIVAAYPRPGAVWTHLVLNHIKDRQARNQSKTIESPDLNPFFSDLLKGKINKRVINHHPGNITKIPWPTPPPLDHVQEVRHHVRRPHVL